MTFDRGVPVALDGEAADAARDRSGALDALGGGSYGFGRVDMIENRRVGIKSRELYEVPGALAIIRAHQALEDLTMERDLAHHKPLMEQRWADLVYDGQWFSPLRQAIDAYVDATQSHRERRGPSAVRTGLVHGRGTAQPALALRPVAGDLRQRGRLRPVGRRRVTCGCTACRLKVWSATQGERGA